MGKNYQMIGEKFGRLLVTEYVETRNYKKYYKCQCDCGNEKIVQGICLRNGHTKSCGCLHNETSRKNVYNSLVKYPNEYSFHKDYCSFTITDKNYVVHNVFIDLDDYDKVKKYQWKINVGGYVVNNRAGFLHRFVLNLGRLKETKITVDHIHHNKLDNRKTKLRACSQRQNNQNQRRKGYVKESGKFIVRMGFNGKTKRFGTYENEEDAILARRELEKQRYGEFAYDYKSSVKAD